MITGQILLKGVCRDPKCGKELYLKIEKLNSQTCKCGCGFGGIFKLPTKTEKKNISKLKYL